MKESNIDIDIQNRLIRMSLTAARKSSNMSQKDIALKTGLSTSTISSIENNDESSPTLLSIIKYAEAIGYTFQTIKKSNSDNNTINDIKEEVKENV